MQRSSNTTLVKWTVCIMSLVYSFPGTSAQYFEITHRPQPAYYHAAAGHSQHFDGWHDALADLDHIFSVLASENLSAKSTVKVQEQVRTDSNHTSHLYISVLEQHRCKAHTPVQLNAVQVSVVEDLLTVTANTTHGAFMRSYQLPEHALPDKLTAVYTKEKVLHIACPTDVPPAPEPLLIDIVVEPTNEPEPAPEPAPQPGPSADPAATPADSAPPSASSPSHAPGDNEWTMYKNPADHRWQTHTPKNEANNMRVADKSTQSKSSLDAISVHAYIKTLEADLARLKTLL